MPWVLASLWVLNAYLIGANLMEVFLCNMIERGWRTMVQEGYDWEVAQACRRMGYERLTASVLLWPLTLIELVILFGETLRELK